MNHKLAIMIVVAFIFQYIYYYNDDLLSGLPFLKGVPLTSSLSTEAIFLIGWYFPIFFILMFFSGYSKKNFVSQGIAFIVRNESKFKLSMKGLLKVATIILLLVSIQTLIFLINYSSDNTGYKELLLSLTVYYLFLLSAVSFQSYLDLHVPSQVSLILINILVLLGALVTKLYYQNYKFLEYLNFSSSSMGYRNGLTGDSSLYHIDAALLIIVIIGMITLIQIISFIKIKKMDII